MGGHILPGMLSMLGEQFHSVVFPVLKLLYRLPDQDWLDTGSLKSSLGAHAGGSGPSIGDVFIIESTARLMKMLSDFGAADVDWGTTQCRSDHAAVITLFTDGSLAKPDYRMRLTPLGRYGIQNILASEGHTARTAGDLAAADAATLLDALLDYDPAGFNTELNGWPAGRDHANAVAQRPSREPTPTLRRAASPRSPR